MALAVSFTMVQWRSLNWYHGHLLAFATELLTQKLVAVTAENLW